MKKLRKSSLPWLAHLLCFGLSLAATSLAWGSAISRVCVNALNSDSTVSAEQTQEYEHLITKFRLKLRSPQSILREAIEKGDALLFDALLYTHKKAKAEWEKKDGISNWFQRITPQPYALNLVFSDQIDFTLATTNPLQASLVYYPNDYIASRLIEELHSTTNVPEIEQGSFWKEAIKNAVGPKTLSALYAIDDVRKTNLQQLTSAAADRGEWALMREWGEKGLDFDPITLLPYLDNPEGSKLFNDIAQKKLTSYKVNEPDKFEQFWNSIPPKLKIENLKVLLLRPEISWSPSEILRNLHFDYFPSGSLFKDQRVLLYLINESLKEPQYAQIKNLIESASISLHSEKMTHFVKENLGRTKLSLTEFLLISAYQKNLSPYITVEPLLHQNPHLLGDFAEDLMWFALATRNASLQVVLEELDVSGAPARALQDADGLRIFNPNLKPSSLVRRLGSSNDYWHQRLIGGSNPQAPIATLQQVLPSEQHGKILSSLLVGNLKKNRSPYYYWDSLSKSSELHRTDIIEVIRKTIPDLFTPDQELTTEMISIALKKWEETNDIMKRAKLSQLFQSAQRRDLQIDLLTSFFKTKRDDFLPQNLLEVLEPMTGLRVEGIHSESLKGQNYNKLFEQLILIQLEKPPLFGDLRLHPSWLEPKAVKSLDDILSHWWASQMLNTKFNMDRLVALGEQTFSLKTAEQVLFNLNHDLEQKIAEIFENARLNNNNSINAHRCGWRRPTV